MEYAGRDIADEALRAAMRDTGLGTPATRAATIETLVKRGFITRQGKQIIATETGIALIEGLPVASLASPELTGTWEARLARVARGQEARAAFMNDIARYVSDVVNAIRGAPSGGGASASRAALPSSGVASATAKVIIKPAAKALAKATAKAAAAPAPPGPPAPELVCPRCKQASLLTGKRGWGCGRWREGCSFVIWFETAGRRLTEAQLRELIGKGKTRKATWSPTGDATERLPGRLVLDVAAGPPAGSARFEPA